MDSQQLTTLLTRDPRTRRLVRGVYARDRLPRDRVGYPSGFIVNTHPHTKAGEHWIAMYIDGTGVGEYFDSFGLPPLHKAFTTFLARHCVTWTFNTQTVQAISSSTCGLYCVYYLTMRSRGVTLKQLLRVFDGDLAANDGLVNDVINKV